MGDIGQVIDDARGAMAGILPDIYPDTCSILRAAEDRDAGGEAQQTWPSISDNVPCKYRALSAFETAVGGGVEATATHRLRLPMLTDVTAKDRITVDARGGMPQMTFEVVGLLPSSTALVLQLDAKLITP